MNRMVLTGGKRKYSEKNVSQCHFRPGIEPGPPWCKGGDYPPEPWQAHISRKCNQITFANSVSTAQKTKCFDYINHPAIREIIDLCSEYHSKHEVYTVWAKLQSLQC
jgi:hypothetical protein